MNRKLHKTKASGLSQCVWEKLLCWQRWLTCDTTVQLQSLEWPRPKWFGLLSESQVNCFVISFSSLVQMVGGKEDNLLASFSEKTGAWTEFSLSADLGTQHCQRGPPLQRSLVKPPARVQAKLRPQLYLTPLYSQLGCITKFGIDSTYRRKDQPMM